MNLEELIRTLENKIERDNEILHGIPVVPSKYDERQKILKRINYMKGFIKFLEKERYNNYVESIDKYNNQNLKECKQRIEFFLNESKTKKEIETYKQLQVLSNIPKDFPYKPYQKEIDELERVLKALQENDEKEIEKEKKKRFKQRKENFEKLKEELLEFLLSEEIMKKERRKLLQEKESNEKESSEIENEDVRKATDLILSCIKESKKEILEEIRKIKKD